MLRIRSDVITSIHNAKKAPDLFQYLQNAIELEHSTIPPYLQALYSIRRDSQANQIAAALIRSIVTEEMLHMTIAANVLNAIGGHPVISSPKFIPNYPGPLPMVHEGLIVGLKPVSLNLILNTFMEIETPEDPQHFPVKMAALASTEYGTIGLFYAAIMDKLKEFGNRIFVGDPNRQVVDNDWFPADQLFPIRNVDSAVRGLEIIMRQGEGTSKDPLDGAGAPAHYYRFAEIYYGKRLVPDSSVKEGYSYSGAPIPFDPAGVWNMIPNPKAADYPADSQPRLAAERFNGIYTNLLNSLHRTVNGKPRHLAMAIGGMYELRLAAEALIELTLPSGQQAAPTFEFAMENA